MIFSFVFKAPMGNPVLPDVKYKKAVDTTADILFICDDRTEISETMVDKVVNLFKDSSVDVVYTDYIKNIDGNIFLLF